jgi:glyoxylase-like metal-dependent hydrolase (beta-lactamase superfamily II)
MCLYAPEEGLFFAGDHVLFDITPNICSMGPETDMLGDYLRSLEKVRGLEVRVPFPAHRTTGRVSLRERIGELFVPQAGTARVHLLFAAYYAHLLFRSLYQTIRYKKAVLER